MDKLTDPDYINQKIIDYIEEQRITAAMHRKTYEYANTYEDFLRVIQDTEDIEVLKTIRYYCYTNIFYKNCLDRL